MKLERIIVLLFLALFACSNTAPISSGTWLTSSVTFQDSSVVIEKVSYLSTGLKVYGQVCHPANPGSYPILVFAHGGFEGLTTEWNSGACKILGAKYVMLQPSYRGEDGSEGKIEVCNGEVDDTIEMLKIGQKLPFANRSSVGLIGGSHGGCIVTRAVQRGVAARVVVDMYGPTDWSNENTFLTQKISTITEPSFLKAYQGLLDLLQNAIGGTPTQVPSAYASRSAISSTSALSSFAGSVLIIHGVNDALVPYQQSCNLALQTGGFSSHHVTNLFFTLTTNAPTGCEALSFSTLDPRVTWAGKRYFMIYDAYGHGDGDGLMQIAVLKDALDFLAAKL